MRRSPCERARATPGALRPVTSAKFLSHRFAQNISQPGRALRAAPDDLLEPAQEFAANLPQAFFASRAAGVFARSRRARIRAVSQRTAIISRAFALHLSPFRLRR